MVFAGKVLYGYKGVMPENTSIEIPFGTISIGNSAFYDCSNLTNVTIPNSVKYIGKRAFQNCTKIDNILIPDSVTAIGDSALSIARV